MAKTTKKPVATQKSVKTKKTSVKPSKSAGKKLSPKVVPKKKEKKTVKVTASKPAVSKSVSLKKVTAKTSGNKIKPVPAAKKQVKSKATPAKQVVKKVTSEKISPVKKIIESAPVKEKTIRTFPKGKFDFTDEKGEVTVERKLMALYNLQQIDSQVDKIRIIRGELPLEVMDLEDEIAGLETRIENYVLETVDHEKIIHEKEISIQESQGLIKKYEDQQMNVRNNREYDSLTKEIEFQNLEIQLSQKRIREAQLALDAKNEEIAQFQNVLQDRKNDLEVKKNELDDIVAETEKEENELIKQSDLNHKYIEERLITAYSRIRKNARNGLAVVQIERDACGGCFNKIPPQHQLDIRMHKKIIVCEYCGRILVDDIIVNAVH